MVHRDRKPQNILVNQNCDVKLCDFGLARGPWPDKEASKGEIRTDYVGTRWYRAPDILLEAFTHTPSADLLAESKGRSAHFPGSSSLDQLKKILRVVGTPRREDCLTQTFSELTQQPAFVFDRQPWGNLFSARPVNTTILFAFGRAVDSHLVFPKRTRIILLPFEQWRLCLSSVEPTSWRTRNLCWIGYYFLIGVDGILSLLSRRKEN